jgi:hypothetical protein
VNGNRQLWSLLIGIALVLIGIGGLSTEFFPALIMLLIGGYLLWQQQSGSDEAGRRSQRTMGYNPREQAEPDYDYDGVHAGKYGTETVYSHALRAAERAGYNPDEMQVLPVDIGVMAFKGDSDPVVYRSRAVPDDVDYVQPFVQLRLPIRATGRIRFEVLDSDDQVLFIHEDHYQLERGRNLITPTARLPIHDAHAMQAGWKLRVSADGTLLANHLFEWLETSVPQVRRYLGEDGEINSELRAALAENRLGRMSLDDLLSSQYGEDEQQRGRR